MPIKWHLKEPVYFIPFNIARVLLENGKLQRQLHYNAPSGYPLKLKFYETKQFEKFGKLFLHTFGNITQIIWDNNLFLLRLAGGICISASHSLEQG